MAKTRGAFVYEETDSGFQKLHPITRTVFMLCAIATTFCIQHPVILAVLYAVVLGVAIYAKMSKKLFLVYIAVIGIGALISFISWLPFGGDVGGDVYFETGKWFGISIAFSNVGFMWAVTMGLRILCSSLPIFLYLSSTRLRDMTIGFCGIGVPFTVGELFVLAFRFVPLVQNDAAIITEAQRARGLDFEQGGVKAKAQKYSAILAPMIFMSLRRIQLVANALDTKGFRNKLHKHRFYKKPACKPIDYALIGICLLIFALALTARILGWMVLVPGRL
ncbi:MAG: energy-coupling factor transporter transmembrane protein EcfT [Clostridia bacterium]|nr:energy-coupling factor transporter transmembrane protein EcfT [Clostridia bacterium]